MDNHNSEITRLTERIAKEPNSKLFVSLAEEHKKAGDPEMAIHVLLEGLQTNPGYVPARVFLGKLLLGKRDFSSAQKEFEEVVKTTPDNLMARKSLGDILVLQNKLQDALASYKSALSLNPRDEELAAVISDIEAGRDVKSKVQHSWKLPSTEPAVQEEPWAWPETHKPAAETPPASASLMTENEEAEEVLIVEPLEPDAFSPEPRRPDDAVPGEQELEQVSSADADEPFDFNAPLLSHEETEAVLKENTPAGQDLFQEMDGESSVDSIFVPGAGEGVSDTDQEETFADSSEKSDDFTTDTLAELYIAQGFYEKAIEIYERMLSDKPTSRGLQDKLAAVRASAARTVAPAPEEKTVTDSSPEMEAKEYFPPASFDAVPEEPSVFDEPKEYRPQQDLAESFSPEVFAEAREYVPPSSHPEEITIDAEVVSEPGEFTPGASREENAFDGFGEYTPESDLGEQLSVGGDAGFEALVHAPQENTGTTPQNTDFEPREYLPPQSESAPLNQEAARKAIPAGRKETLARLETWLSNIKKEK